MAKHVDYYLALNSPWAYLGAARLRDLTRRAGVGVRVMPVKLGVVFAATGGVALPRRAPARQAYRLAELKRWRAVLQIPILLEPDPFPCDETAAARAVLACAAAGGDALGLTIALGRALWEDGRDLADPAVIDDCLTEIGADAAAILAAAEAPAIVDAYEALSDAAIAAGVFAVPTYRVGEEIYWGQDRLDFVARALGLGGDIANIGHDHG